MMEFSIDTSSDFAMAESTALAVDKALLHLPPMWDKVGKLQVYLDFHEDGKHKRSGIEDTVSKGRLREIAMWSNGKFNELHKRGAKRITLHIDWVSNDWYPEYGDHYRKSFELEYAV